VSGFDEAARVIERAVASRAFPAATIDVGRRDRVLWHAAFGRLTYAPDAPATAPDTIFDLASLTKVIATVPLVMSAVEAGALALDDRVADRLPAWRGADREDVTVADLLEHASGLTAYLPFFRDHHGRADFERAICTLPLEYAPRTQSIYSDLGFMLLAFILEDVNQMPFDKQFDRLFRLKAETTRVDTTRVEGGVPSESCSFRLQAEGAEGLELLFNPPRALRERCAPTELDLWRGRLLQGEVHDENTWALGGAAGHAGLFGTAASVGTFARLILNGLLARVGNRPLEADNRKLEAGSWKPEAGNWKLETLERFARKSHVPGSSRALGWDTMLHTSSCGTRLSPRAIGHTGFTGTSLWIDPALDLYVVLLTNRVHPARDNNRIQPMRRAVHDAIVASVNGEP
jgi:CubicO group peptidase (beta-lactamase class C family)